MPDDPESGEESSEDEADDDGISEDVCLILDNGSGSIKAGLSTDQQPKHIFPEIVGKPREQWKKKYAKDLYVGDDCVEGLDHMTVRHPIENGIIENFEDMEKLWEYTFFEKLDANPMRHPVILTEPPYNPKPNREKVAEMMFESFGVPSLNISIQGVLALLGHGRTSGVVLSSGEGVTSTIPIFDGFGLPHCINRMDTAGKDLNTILGKLLAKGGLSLVKSTEKFEVAKIKEQHCFVSQDPSEESTEAVEHTLPDGRKVTLKDERWQATEALFNPAAGGLESENMGVASMVWDTVSKCELDTRRTLLSNIVIAGGSTMFPGFSERLSKEIKAYAPSGIQTGVRVVQGKNPQNTVWIGGQIFASLRAMQEDQWVTIEDYDERGVGYIHEKIAVKYK